jgi:hypothetical protein
MLNAPHTICSASPLPVSTSTRWTLSASGWDHAVDRRADGFDAIDGHAQHAEVVRQRVDVLTDWCELAQP